MGRSWLGGEGHFQQREQPMQRPGVKPCLPYPPVAGDRHYRIWSHILGVSPVKLRTSALVLEARGSPFFILCSFISLFFAF